MKMISRRIGSNIGSNILMKSLFFSLCIFSVNVLANTLQPFTTDGCSAFPDGTLTEKNLWLRCCSLHDIAYWQGGSYQERVEADDELKRCVDNIGEPVIAHLMRVGVRVGGSPYFPTDFRWGYGWPYPRGYKALSNEEKIQVDIAIKKMMPARINIR